MAAMATTTATSSRFSAGGLTQLGGDAAVVEAARGWSSAFVLGKATVEIPNKMELGLGLTMAEQIISLHVELLPEGCYLATSEAIPGLVAQGRTVAETLEIARDVAKRLLEARADRGELTAMSPVGDSLDLPLVVGG
jgi:predicted RNase H-like HicB family nuclease